MGLLTQAGGLLKQGWNVLGNSTSWVADKVSYAGDFYKNKFFPTSQKTSIVSSNVSTQPYTGFFGFRPTAPESQTVNAPWYQTWWDNSVKSSEIIWDKVTGMFRSEKQKAAGKTINTLWQTAGDLAVKAINTLPSYFDQKWNLTPRSGGGDNIGNTPLVQNTPVVYSEPGQSNAPVTTPGLFSDLISFFQEGSQPQGSYSIGYPQQAAIPSGGGMNLTTIGIFLGLGVSAYFIFKGKK